MPKGLEMRKAYCVWDPARQFGGKDEWGGGAQIGEKSRAPFSQG